MHRIGLAVSETQKGLEPDIVLLLVGMMMLYPSLMLSFPSPNLNLDMGTCRPTPTITRR